LKQERDRHILRAAPTLIIEWRMRSPLRENVEKFDRASSDKLKVQ
jgi:hypothetical protein